MRTCISGVLLLLPISSKCLGQCLARGKCSMNEHNCWRPPCAPHFPTPSSWGSLQRQPRALADTEARRRWSGPRELICVLNAVCVAPPGWRKLPPRRTTSPAVHPPNRCTWLIGVRPTRRRMEARGGEVGFICKVRAAVGLEPDQLPGAFEPRCLRSQACHCHTRRGRAVSGRKPARSFL